MQKTIEKIVGKNPGGTSIILSGVHGDERSGIEAMKTYFENVSIDAGTVYYGIANPEAVEKNSRFTEANLNRLFRDPKDLSKGEVESYEYERMLYLKEYLDESEVLLDLHASSNPITKPFVICEPNGFELVESLPSNLIVSGFDEYEPGGTDFYMNSIGKIGICFEAGYATSPEAKNLSVQAIESFLIARGHIVKPQQKIKQQKMRIFSKHYCQSGTFTLAKKFDDFEEIKKDQLIGLDGEKEIVSPKDCFILFAHNIDNVGGEAFLLAL